MTAPVLDLSLMGHELNQIFGVKVEIRCPDPSYLITTVTGRDGPKRFSTGLGRPYSSPETGRARLFNQLKYQVAKALGKDPVGLP